jgi:hypothetical protein
MVLTFLYFLRWLLVCRHRCLSVGSTSKADDVNGKFYVQNHNPRPRPAIDTQAEEETNA